MRRLASLLYRGRWLIAGGFVYALGVFICWQRWPAGREATFEFDAETELCGLSPDGLRAAFQIGMSTFQFREVRTGKLISQPILEPDGDRERVCRGTLFSYDGAFACCDIDQEWSNASGSGGRAEGIRLYCVTSGGRLNGPVLKDGHPSRNRHVSFACKSRTLIYLEGEGDRLELLLWDLDAEAVRARIPIRAGPWELDQQEHRIARYDERRQTIEVRDLTTLELERSYPISWPHSLSDVALRFLPDGKTLGFLASYDSANPNARRHPYHVVCLCDLTKTGAVQVFDLPFPDIVGNANEGRPCLFRRLGKNDGKTPMEVEMIDPWTRAKLGSVSVSGYWPSHEDVSVYRGWGRRYRLEPAPDLARYALDQEVAEEPKQDWRPSWLQKLAQLAWGDDEPTYEQRHHVMVCDMQTGRPIADFPNRTFCRFSPDGKRFAVSRNRKGKTTIEIWNVAFARDWLATLGWPVLPAAGLLAIGAWRNRRREPRLAVAGASGS